MLSVNKHELNDSSWGMCVLRMPEQNPSRMRYRVMTSLGEWLHLQGKSYMEVFVSIVNGHVWRGGRYY